MPGLVVSGHASWSPSISPAHATLHHGQEVHLYQEVLHLVPESLTLQLEQLLPELLTNPVRRFRDHCPNFTVVPPTGVDRVFRFDPTADYEQLIPDRETTLAEIVARYPGHTIHWGACPGVDLNGVGGQAVGVNLGWDGNQNMTSYASAGDLTQETEASRAAFEGTTLSYESFRPNLEFQALIRAAFPAGSVAEEWRMCVAHLWEAREHGPEAMAGLFAADLDPEARRGLLMNDVLRHWLEDQGLYTRGGCFNDRMLTVSVPAFWTATAEPADDEARELFVYSDLPPDRGEAFAALRLVCAGAHDIRRAVADLTPEQRQLLLHDAYVRQTLYEAGYREEEPQGEESCVIL
ncbi:putative adhesin [Streptomyces sp. NPDC001594]|uniref:putative adhesin n=1 Tax=Streptomyces sp. NPDC001594 TaxID=3364590 RepID=UPI0036B229B2